MKRLLTAMAISLMATAAQANTTMYQGKYWSTVYVPKNGQGYEQCLVQGTWTFRDGSSGSMLMKFNNRIGVFLHVFKSSWTFGEGSVVPLQIWFDKGGREGSGITYRDQDRRLSYIEINVPKDPVGFVEDFANAKQLVIRFKSGNEPDWVGYMEGSREAVAYFGKCVVGITKPAGTSPVPPQATSPVPPQATSPVPNLPVAPSTSPVQQPVITRSKDNGSI